MPDQKDHGREEGITFIAQKHDFKQDADGEYRIVLKVPQSERIAMRRMLALTKVNLQVAIVPLDPSVRYRETEG